VDIKFFWLFLGFLFAIYILNLTDYYALGSENVKVEPLPGALLTSIAPSRDSAIFLAMPSPVHNLQLGFLSGKYPSGKTCQKYEVNPLL
jgi:hypothetical protein